MFFYIPGILVLIVAILIAFLVVPRMAPTILAITAIVLLSLGLYHHYKLFSMEYRLSTWQEGLKFWAGPIMIGLLVLTIIGYFFNLFVGGGSPFKKNNNAAAAAAAAAVLPPAVNTAVNNAAKAANSVVNTVVNTSKNIVEDVGNAMGFNMNKRNNKGPAPNANYSRSFYEKV